MACIPHIKRYLRTYAIKSIAGVFVFGMLLSLYQIVYAATAPYFLLEATEGQGVGSDEFYVGRCFRVNMRVNTNSTNTNGADVEINYDNSIL